MKVIIKFIMKKVHIMYFISSVMKCFLIIYVWAFLIMKII